MTYLGRITGGQNNWKGNAYEVAFAVCRCLELAASVPSGVTVTFQVQTGEPIDDLKIQKDSCWEYCQIKDDQSITWTAREGKLRTEFCEQRQACESRQETYALRMVVSHDTRKQSLERNMPTELSEVTEVRLFARPMRISELSRYPELQAPLSELCASSKPGGEIRRALVEGFFLAWSELAQPGQVLPMSQILQFIENRPIYRLRCQPPNPIHPRWVEFENHLRTIPRIRWDTQRGYWEWWSDPVERGLFPYPCASNEFQRFVDRVVRNRPITLDNLMAEM